MHNADWGPMSAHFLSFAALFLLSISSYMMCSLGLQKNVLSVSPLFSPFFKTFSDWSVVQRPPLHWLRSHFHS